MSRLLTRIPRQRLQAVPLPMPSFPSPFSSSFSSSSPCHLHIRHYSLSRCDPLTRSYINKLVQPAHDLQHCFSSPSFSTTTASTSFVDDTIYALSSGSGKAGIAVIRISGSLCLDIYKSLCPSAPKLRPRYAAVRTLYDPAGGKDAVLDSSALVLFFPGPNSVTGEDVLELHVHGGPATIKAVLSALPRCTSPSHQTYQPSQPQGPPPGPGLQRSGTSIRYAAPGEFTRRAFFHNRLDLAQVEALGDTLDAATEHQRRAAIRGSSGKLGQTYESWRSLLLEARAEIEALIDFSEDQHFDESPRQLLSGVATRVHELRRLVSVHESAADRSSLLRSGIRIALVGPANAGKSSLMNLVVGREASIVSHEAGTTRDVVEASLDIRGYLCTFADTAGFRRASSAKRSPSNLSSSTLNALGAVEAEGIRRARQKAADSDIVIALASVEASDTGFYVNFDEEALRLAAAAGQSMVVLNKCDLVKDSEELARLVEGFRSVVEKTMDGARDCSIMAISCRPSTSPCSPADDHASDVHRLVDRLATVFMSMTDFLPDEQDLLGVTARQQQLLAECRHHLEDFLAEAGVEITETNKNDTTGEGPEGDVVLAAEHLRYAADCLARITGRGEAGDIEEVLGVIFEK